MTHNDSLQQPSERAHGGMNKQDAQLALRKPTWPSELRTLDIPLKSKRTTYKAEFGGYSWTVYIKLPGI